MPHIHENYDFIVSAFIVFGEKVLLVEHPRYGKWLPVGGHIELDEDPEMALFREIEEECGMKVDILSGKPKVNFSHGKYLLMPNNIAVHEANAPHKHISLIYYARAKNDAVKQSKEHTSYKWFAEEELKAESYKLDPDVIYDSIAALRMSQL